MTNEGNISGRCILQITNKLDHLHRPDVHFGPILPVSEQLRGCVGRTSTLGVEELQGQRLGLQSVAQAEVCVKDHLVFVCADVLDKLNQTDWTC